MLRVAKISAAFKFVDAAVVKFDDKLEVALDCCVCHRCRRTVVFKVGDVEGKCAPTGHPFPGKIIEKKPSASSVVYQLEYWYEPFDDAKYHEQRKPDGAPTWARVHFSITCPSCGFATQRSTQNNIVRPSTCRCKCGQILYTQSDEMPVLYSV